MIFRLARAEQRSTTSSRSRPGPRKLCLQRNHQPAVGKLENLKPILA